MSLNSFINNIKKIDKPRHHKITNSYGVYDAYKYYRKNKPKDKKFILSESQYFKIIRNINNILSDNLSKGKDIILPLRMGKLEIRKYNTKIEFKDNKLVTNMPIDWLRTLQLWYDDKESYTDKRLLRIEEKEVFRVYYNKTNANYNNKAFYKFEVNRELRIKLKQNIKEGKVDAFLF